MLLSGHHHRPSPSMYPRRNRLFEQSNDLFSVSSQSMLLYSCCRYLNKLTIAFARINDTSENRRGNLVFVSARDVYAIPIDLFPGQVNRPVPALCLNVKLDLNPFCCRLVHCAISNHHFQMNTYVFVKQRQIMQNMRVLHQNTFKALSLRGKAGIYPAEFNRLLKYYYIESNPNK